MRDRRWPNRKWKQHGAPSSKIRDALSGDGFTDELKRQRARVIRQRGATTKSGKDQLVINLKTAKTIGLTIPAALLAQAEEVIE